MSPQHLLGSADLGSRVNAAQRGLISLLLEAGWGDAGSGKFLGLETFSPPFSLFNNELDLNEF